MHSTASAAGAHCIQVEFRYYSMCYKSVGMKIQSDSKWVEPHFKHY